MNNDCRRRLRCSRGTAERALDHIEHYDRLQAMRVLEPSEREALYLKGLGYSYREIMRLTGSSYTAVNRRLSARPRRSAPAHRRGKRPAPVVSVAALRVRWSGPRGRTDRRLPYRAQ